MSARDEILGRIGSALTGADRSLREVPRGYRTAAPAEGTAPAQAPAPARDLVTLFVERVEDYRAVVTRCSAGQVADRLRSVVGTASVIVPDGFGYDVAGALHDTGQSGDDLDAVAVVVTEASVAIAETGTIVLSHGPGQGRRALTLVPDLHVCVVREDQVVPGVPEAVALLDPDRPQTWISGPSATSDIELNRVEGVHGPRTLHVLVVG
jgi:L-lactate dehydrogenase complex protein LldG